MKLGQIHGVRREAVVAEGLLQRVAARLHDDVPPDHDGVARKPQRVGVAHRDRFGDELADDAAAVVVERGRIVECAAIVQRAEAGVEVVEARIDQFQRRITQPSIAAIAWCERMSQRMR